MKQIIDGIDVLQLTFNVFDDEDEKPICFGGWDLMELCRLLGSPTDRRDDQLN